MHSTTHPEMRHGGPVSPDNVHETGVSPSGQFGSPIVASRGGTGRANSEKDLVTGPIRAFCALQLPRAIALASSRTSPVGGPGRAAPRPVC
jgi:hypothetical protein